MSREKILSKVIKKLSTKKLYHTTNKKHLDSILKNGLVPTVGEYTQMGHGSESEKLVFFLDKPIPDYHGKDTVVLELKNPKNYYIYKFDGYGMEDFNSGKYIEHEDIPAGVEEGDYFTREKVSPKDLKVVK